MIEQQREPEKASDPGRVRAPQGGSMLALTDSASNSVIATHHRSILLTALRKAPGGGSTYDLSRWPLADRRIPQR